MWRKRKNKNINNTVKKDKIKDNSNIKNINKTIVFDKIENINLKSKKNNSNINQKKGSLYKKSNIKSKNEFRTKEKEIEKQKMFLKTFTETEEKKKLRRGSIGRENKKYNLKQNSITIHNRVSSLPDSKKKKIIDLNNYNSVNLSVNKSISKNKNNNTITVNTSINVNTTIPSINIFEKSKEIKTEISKYILSSRVPKQIKNKTDIKNNLYNSSLNITTNEMNSNDTSSICNSIVSNVTTKKRKVINFPITNLNLYSQRDNVKLSKIKLSKITNKTLNDSINNYNDNSIKPIKKTKIRLSTENFFAPLTERNKFRSNLMHESFVEEKKIVKNHPRKYYGIIDLLCVSYKNLEDSIKYIKNILKNNSIFFIQTTNYIFRCNKFSTSFDIEIVEIDKKIYYYLIKIKNGSVFTEKKLIKQFFG